MSYNLSTGSGLIVTTFYDDAITKPIALAGLEQYINGRNTFAINDVSNAGSRLLLYTTGAETNIRLKQFSGIAINRVADASGTILTPEVFFVDVLTPDESAPLPYYPQDGSETPHCIFDRAESNANNSWASISTGDYLVHLVPGYYRFDWSLALLTA